MKGLQIGGRETRFRPGSKPQTWLPVGTEIVNKDGNLMRKVSDEAPAGRARQSWKPVQVIEWEARNGPVPPGHFVVFRNRNKRDFSPGNLELVDRAENMRRNAYYNRYPKEVARAIQLRGALNRQIRKREQA